MPRYFTLREAEALLPELQERLRQTLADKALLEEIEGRLRGTAERVMLAGGARVDRAKVAEDLKLREGLAGRLKERIQEIEGRGCLLKDLDIGLLDFPTLFRGEEVYLCWKLGESRIGFWHAVSAGFAGRKAIDEEFLAGHGAE